jgi:hypothetical protein
MTAYLLVFKMSALSFVFFSSALFSMNKADNRVLAIKAKKLTKIDQQHQAFIPVEVMVLVAAGGDGEIKNKLWQTCRFFKMNLSRNNPVFLSHPLFKAHQQDVKDIMCSAIWFNNTKLENALKTHYKDVVPFKFYSTANASTSVAADHLRVLRDRYNNNNPHQVKRLTHYDTYWEMEPALYCAIQCNDYEAVHNIAEKIKNVASRNDKQLSLRMHTYLLMSLIQKDRTKMFDLVVKHDLFNSLNCYITLPGSVSTPSSYYGPFLDILKQSEVSQELKNKYSSMYKQYGGKSLNQLQKEESDDECANGNDFDCINCIIC